MAKVALLIGVSDYGPGFNSLPGTIKDVAAMRRVLQHPDIGGFTEVTTLANPEPLVMQEAIEALFKEKVRQRDDLALLFFSGHCVNDHNNKLYFATRNTRKNAKGELVKSTAVPASFVQDIMSDSRSRQQVVILDCCFSNAFADVWSAKNYGSVDVKNQLSGEGRVVLTSSTSTQQFFPQKGSEISKYTRHLVEGIATGAADIDKDQYVSVYELHQYAGSKSEEAAATIEPEIYAVKESYSILLAKAPLEQLQPIYYGEDVTADNLQNDGFSARLSNELTSNPGTTKRTDSRIPVRNSQSLMGAGIATILVLIGVVYGLDRWFLQQLPISAAATTYKDQVPTIFEHSKTVWSLAFSPNNQLLASSSGDKTIKLWHLQSGELLRTFSGEHLDTVWSVAISPDEQTIVSGSGDKTIKIWNLNTGKLLRTLSGHKDTVRSVAISLDGQTIVSGSGDKTVKIWNLNTGKLLRTLSGHTDAVRSVAISPNGQTVASGGADNTVKIWNLNSGELLHTLSGHTSRIISIAISPDGEIVASGSNDNTIKLWNLRTGELVRTLLGHSDHINSIAIRSDGKVLVSGAEDHLIKLWNLQTGELLDTLSRHSEDVYAVSLSPDGKTLASGDKDGEIKLGR
ncbi:caspase family protein [Chroococcidiopsis sp. CCMEE 29]|uniref:caspase, EACC1-associated type n=1 Tax=Chroococcidiopsis sp. CCMEE 29 TaxID=155894 RepID=UPI002022347D|nr:caspase family protein [Chroococcidiopsis sp. CCMEE 29]